MDAGETSSQIFKDKTHLFCATSFFASLQTNSSV